MITLIIVIHIIACFILIATILLQAGRGGGLSGLFGSGATQTIFGARASTFLTRATTVAAIAFLLTSISLTVFSSRRGKSLLEGVTGITEKPLVEPVSPAIPEEIQPEETQNPQTQPEEIEEMQEEKPKISEEQPPEAEQSKE